MEIIAVRLTGKFRKKFHDARGGQDTNSFLERIIKIGLDEELKKKNVKASKKNK